MARGVCTTRPYRDLVFLIVVILLTCCSRAVDVDLEVHLKGNDSSELLSEGVASETLVGGHAPAEGCLPDEATQDEITNDDRCTDADLGSQELEPPPEPATCTVILSQQQEEAVQSSPEGVRSAGEDLDIKTLSNFALGKEGARVLATNIEARKPAALLDDDSDTFLKNDCKAAKWAIIELSAVATPSVFELVQNELYSSRVKDFEVYSRQSHPRQDAGSNWTASLNSSAWNLAGNFTAENKKGVQYFTFPELGWARYCLIRFRTHYGSETVCAINGIAVYGKSAAEELEDELAAVSAVSEAIDEPEMNDEQFPRDDGVDEESDVEVDTQDFNAGIKSEQVPPSSGDEDEDGPLGADLPSGLDPASAAYNAENEALHEGDILMDAPGAPSRPMQALEDAKADRGKRPSQLTKEETETLSHVPPKRKGSRTVYDILIKEIKSIKLQIQIINRLLEDADPEPKLINELKQVRQNRLDYEDLSTRLIAQERESLVLKHQLHLLMLAFLASTIVTWFQRTLTRSISVMFCLAVAALKFHQIMLA